MPSRSSKTSKLAIIMSTSESKSGPSGSKEQGTPVNIWEGVSAVPAGLPDPAVLARMATEFFTAVPGFSPPSGTVPNIGSLSSVTHGQPPMADFPGEAELSALPASLFELPSSSSSFDNMRLPGYPPVAPGDLSSIGFGGVPGFSFLDEARPLFPIHLPPEFPPHRICLVRIIRLKIFHSSRQPPSSTRLALTT